MLAAAVWLAGCGPSGHSASPGPPATPKSYAVATGPSDLLLSITIEGAMPTPADDAAVPLFALYGDGRLIVHPDGDIPRGSAPFGIRELTATPAEIQTILWAADGAGLLGPDARLDGPPVTDVGNTVFRTRVGGTRHTISAWALGMETSAPLGTTPRRERLLRFERAVLDPVTFLGGPASDLVPFRFTEIRVFVYPNRAASTGGARRWPLAGDPVGEPCLLLSGPDMDAFLAAGAVNDYGIIWESASGRFTGAAHPLYPNETGCRPSSFG